MDSEWVDIKDNFLSEDELEKIKNHIYYDMTWRYTDSDVAKRRFEDSNAR